MDERLIVGLEQALDADPDNHLVRCHLAQVLLDAGRPAAALAHAHLVTAARPDDEAAVAIAARAAEELVGDRRGGVEDTVKETRESTSRDESVDRDLDAVRTDGAVPEKTVWDVFRPEVGLDDVAGMEQVKERLHRGFFAPMRNPELRQAFAATMRQGLLLYGPPGCGKTYLARALAGELGVYFISVGLPDVLDIWVGSSERNLRHLFETARSMAPTVLFFDEVDALGHKRSGFGGHATGRNVVNTLLAELDGAESDNDELLLLAATNRPWDVDPALRRPGRFDRAMFVPPPDREARARLLADRLARVPTTAGLDVARITEVTERYSGADLVHLVETAAEAALSSSIDGGEVLGVTQRQLEAAASEVQPSTVDWLRTAKMQVTYGNADGMFDDLATYLRERRI